MMNSVMEAIAAACPIGASRIYRGMLMRRAQKLHTRGDTKQAINCFERALTIADGDSRVSVRYALVMLENGNSARAIELLESACKTEPDSPVPITFLGLALSDAGRNTEACEALSQACKMAENNLLPSSCLALAWLREGRIEQAVEHFKKNGITDNLSVRARIIAEVESILHKRQDQTLMNNLLPAENDAADDVLKKPADNQSGRSCYRQGVKSFHKGRLSEAEEFFEAARARGSDEEEMPLYFAGLLLQKGQLVEAAEMLLAIPEKSPVCPVALFYTGAARYHEGDIESALKHIDGAIEGGAAFELEEYIYHYRGLCLQAMGDASGARRIFEQALDIDWKLLPRRLEALNAGTADN